MKAEELMIGDWLMLNKIPRKVVELTEDYIELAFYQKPGDVISPITLTPEILEKNGFAADGFRAYVKDDVTVYPATNKDRFTDIDHPVLSVWKAGHVRELNIRCDYVHTLQHALRLCGLTELADNIKIE